MDLENSDKSWKLFSSGHTADTLIVYFREVCGEIVICIRTETNPGSAMSIPYDRTEVEITEGLFPAFNVAAEVMIRHMRENVYPGNTEKQGEIEVSSYGSEKAILIDHCKRSFLVRYCHNMLPIKTMYSQLGLQILEKEMYFPIKICMDVNDVNKMAQLLKHVRETLHAVRRRRLIGEPFSIFPPNGFINSGQPAMFDSETAGEDECGKDKDENETKSDNCGLNFS